MLQLCTMATVHYGNVVWVHMSIIHPTNWLPVVENSHLFARRTVRPPGARQHWRCASPSDPAGGRSILDPAASEHTDVLNGHGQVTRARP